MSNFRSPAEMQEIYENQEYNTPYILEYKNNGQILVFFGSVHSKDPTHPQWPTLDEAWQKFTQNSNPQKTVMYEGGQEVDTNLENNEILQKYGESGVIAKKAHDVHLPSESPEPDRLSEVEHLKQHFTVPQIATYYFGRQMLQWHEHDRQLNPDWQAYAAGTLQRYDSLGCWGNEEINLGRALGWFQQEVGKDFDPEDRQTLYAISDPSQSEVSAASGQFRDELLFAKIKEKLGAGNDVFVVYGSGHAIRLEPALKELSSKNWGEL